jgi:hypothetical protein
MTEVTRCGRKYDFLVCRKTLQKGFPSIWWCNFCKLDIRRIKTLTDSIFCADSGARKADVRREDREFRTQI